MGGTSSKSTENMRITRITDTDKAILQLKSQRDQLAQQRRRLELQAVKDEKAAIQLLHLDKKQLAILALRKKKHHLLLVDKIDGHTLQIQEIISSIEISQMQVDVVKALEVGNSALKAVQKELSLDVVERLVEDMQSYEAHVEAVNQSLYGTGLTEDYPDLQLELDALAVEVTNSAGSDAYSSAPHPSATGQRCARPKETSVQTKKEKLLTPAT